MVEHVSSELKVVGCFIFFSLFEKNHEFIFFYHSLFRMTDPFDGANRVVATAIGVFLLPTVLLQWNGIQDKNVLLPELVVRTFFSPKTLCGGLFDF